MSAKVILTVQGGRYDGHELIFDDHRQYVLGRARDCSFAISDRDDNLVISRHHCQLTVELPAIQIRDLGSRNGTYVNGTNIGQRRRDLAAEQAAAESWPEYPLHEGDQVKIGDLIFKVGIARDAENKAPSNPNRYCLPA